MNITEFLLARIAEDEAAANAVDLLSSEMETISAHYLPEFADYMLRWQPNAIRAECAAKRAIVEHHAPNTSGPDATTCNSCGDWWDGTPEPYPCPTLKAIAAVYKDNLDYQEERTHGDD